MNLRIKFSSNGYIDCQNCIARRKLEETKKGENFREGKRKKKSVVSLLSKVKNLFSLIGTKDFSAILWLRYYTVLCNSIRKELENWERKKERVGEGERKKERKRKEKKERKRRKQKEKEGNRKKKKEKGIGKHLILKYVCGS